MTSVEFHRPLAFASDYPSPHISATPQKFHWAPWGQSFNQQTQFAKNSFFTKNGRSALAYIINGLNLEQGSKVLLPEYHCPAMIEPFVWANVNIEFYRLNSDLSIDIEAFEKQLENDVGAVLLVRFFGFATNIEEALVKAKTKSAYVIEDCAHAFFSEQLQNKEQRSDASFCSLNKFFSCFDGGMLRTLNQQLKTNLKQLKGPGPLKDIKHFLGKFESVEYIFDSVKKVMPRANNLSIAHHTDENKGQPEKQFRYFSQNDMKHRCFGATKAQVLLENYDHIAFKRRNNYQYLYKGLLQSNLGKAVFCLDDETVPYVFPFLLNDKSDFTHVRQSGVQILRWEEFCSTKNNIVESYRERLVQIPCHQDLSTEQLDFIIKQFNKN